MGQGWRNQTRDTWQQQRSPSFSESVEPHERVSWRAPCAPEHLPTCPVLNTLYVLSHSISTATTLSSPFYSHGNWGRGRFYNIPPWKRQSWDMNQVSPTTDLYSSQRWCYNDGGNSLLKEKKVVLCFLIRVPPEEPKTLGGAKEPCILAGLYRRVLQSFCWVTPRSKLF